jgi:hypothetical protein
MGLIGVTMAVYEFTFDGIEETELEEFTTALNIFLISKCKGIQIVKVMRVVEGKELIQILTDNKGNTA